MSKSTKEKEVSLLSVILIAVLAVILLTMILTCVVEYKEQIQHVVDSFNGFLLKMFNSLPHFLQTFLFVFGCVLVGLVIIAALIFSAVTSSF